MKNINSKIPKENYTNDKFPSEQLPDLITPINKLEQNKNNKQTLPNNFDINELLKQMKLLSEVINITKLVETIIFDRFIRSTAR